MAVSRLICNLVLTLTVFSGTWVPAHAEGEAFDQTVMVAAASSVKPALEEIASAFRRRHPSVDLLLSYGSSGKISTQIRNGAPFDLFFSADMEYPRELVAQGLSASDERLYARGRLVLWHRGSAPPSLDDLEKPGTTKLAIANPRHAPYGQRAREALTHERLWESVQPKLVFGENVAQTAQFIQSGAADFGLIPLSLALNPTMRDQGSFIVLEESLHKPLDHGYILTRQGAGNRAAIAFAEYVESDEAGALLHQHGLEAAVPHVEQ